MSLPHWLWPCEHHAAIQWRCLTQCKDPFLVKHRAVARPIGFALMCVGVVSILSAFIAVR